MLKSIIAIIIAGVMAVGTLGGCGKEEQPSEQLKNSIEESGEAVMPEKVMDEYLLNYGVDLHESDGDCPKCGEKNVELTSLGLCLYCSYDMVYMNENDPEMAAEDDDENNSSYSSNSTLDELMYGGEPTQECESYKVDKNNQTIKVGNDGLLCQCNECQQFFFSNRSDGCPNCHSNNFSIPYFTTEALGYVNNDEVGGSQYDSYDSLGMTCTLYDRNTGKSYSNLDQRFVIQGFAGALGIVRDAKENYKIVGVIINKSKDGYIDHDSYEYSVMDPLIVTIFGGEYISLNSVYIADERFSNIKEALDAIGY